MTPLCPLFWYRKNRFFVWYNAGFGNYNNIFYYVEKILRFFRNNKVKFPWFVPMRSIVYMKRLFLFRTPRRLRYGYSYFCDTLCHSYRQNLTVVELVKNIIIIAYTKHIANVVGNRPTSFRVAKPLFLYILPIVCFAFKIQSI